MRYVTRKGKTNKNLRNQIVKAIINIYFVCFSIRLYINICVRILIEYEKQLRKRMNNNFEKLI